jgi:hypothetical protein
LVLAAFGIGVVTLLYYAMVRPVIAYRKGVAVEIADGLEQLERDTHFLGAVDTFRAERAELKKKLEQAKTRLLPGNNGTLGAAALQERTNAVASEKGIAVQSTQVMREEAAPPFRKVALRLTLSGELKPLTELLSALEFGQQLQVPFVEITRRGVVPGQKGPRTLQATVEVSGYVVDGKRPEAVETEPETGAPGSADGAHTERPPPEPS